MIRLWLYRRRNKLVSCRLFRLAAKERIAKRWRLAGIIPKMEPGDV